MGGVSGAGDGRRKKTSPNPTPKKTKRTRFLSPNNSSKGEGHTMPSTSIYPYEVTAHTLLPKMKVQSGASIESSEESDATVAYSTSTTQSTTHTYTTISPVALCLSPRSMLKSNSTKIAETEEPAVPTTAWCDRTDTPDRASASGSQLGANRSSRERSIEDYSTDSEVAAQLDAVERREFIRTNWFPTQASGAVPAHHALAAAVAPLIGPELFDHLPESTLIYRVHRAMFDIATGQSLPEAQQVRSSVIDSIIHYLERNGGITQENLSVKLARAQAMRVDPRSLPAINLMMAHLTGRPFGPIEDVNLNMAAALADLDLTPPPTYGSRYNAVAHPRRMDSEHGRTWMKVSELQHGLRKNSRAGHIREGDSFTMSIDDRIISRTKNPIQQLHEDDIRHAGLDELQLLRLQANLKSCSDIAKKAVFWRRGPGNDEEYRKGRNGVFDKLQYQTPPPLTEKVDWIKKNMANAPPLFQEEAEDEKMIQPPTLNASSRCRGKNSKMVPVYDITEGEINASALAQTRTVLQYAGSNDGQIDLLEPDFDQKMADLTLQPPLTPLTYSSPTPVNEIPAERLNQFIPLGQTTHIKYEEYMHSDEKMLKHIKTAYSPEPWRELLRVDVSGVMKDELEYVDAMGISDTGADGGIDDEHQDISMIDDEDKSMADAKPLIRQEDYKPEQVQADLDNQMELLVEEHGVQNPSRRITTLRIDPKKRKAGEETHHMKLRNIQEQRDKFITGLPYVMRSNWTEHETVRGLHRNISMGFLPAAKAPKPKAPCERCGRKSHLIKNYKTTAPCKGWQPLKGTKPFPNVNAVAVDGARDQGGPSKIGKHSRAGYPQVLIDSEPNKRFDTRGQARAPLGAFDGAVESSRHIPAHLPKLELNKVEVAEAKQQHHGYSDSMSRKDGGVSPVGPSRVLFKPDDLPMCKQEAKETNRLQETNNARAYLGGFDGADDGLSEEQFAALATMTPTPSQKPGPASPGRVPMLSKPDDPPPSRPLSVDPCSLRGGDLSASIKEGVTKEKEKMPTFKDDDVEMHDLMEMPFPSRLDGRTSAEREESVGLGNFMDEVNAQLMSESMNIEARSEVKDPQSAFNQEVQIAVAREALQVALGKQVAQQFFLQTSIEMSSQAPSATVDMSVPPPSSQAYQTRKMLATSNPFRALSDTPDPIEAAGRAAFPSRDTPIASTPPSNAALSPLRRFNRSSASPTPTNVIDDDEDDDEQIMFTALDAKTQGGNVAGITRPAEFSADGGDEDHNVKHFEDRQDDDFQPDLDIATATPRKKKTSKSLTAKAISDVDIQPKFDAKPKGKTRKSLKAAQTEVPETSDIEQPENTTVVASEQKKTGRRNANATLVAGPTADLSHFDSSKPRRRATHQSTGPAEEDLKTPQAAKSGKMKRQPVDARWEKKNASKNGRRPEAEDDEVEEVVEQETSRSLKRSSRAQTIELGHDVETPARISKVKQAHKRATRFKSTTPTSKSATGELQSNGSDTILYYDNHEWMLPVEIGDRVVRKLSKEDHLLYSKVDEYDEFTGPWIVLDLKIRRRDKERIAQVLDNNLSEELRSLAWNETLTALVKISIPEGAQTKDKVSPWVELRTLLPVLDVDGVQGGKFGPAYPLLEDFDSYKALKNKLANSKWKDGSMNVIRKKEARTRDQNAESSLGLVNLRKDIFVAVVDVDPNWRDDDEYEVEKIRKKKLKLVLRSRATDDELDQEDTDKWQEILKHVRTSLPSQLIPSEQN